MICDMICAVFQVSELSEIIHTKSFIASNSLILSLNQWNCHSLFLVLSSYKAQCTDGMKWLYSDASYVTKFIIMILRCFKEHDDISDEMSQCGATVTRGLTCDARQHVLQFLHTVIIIIINELTLKIHMRPVRYSPETTGTSESDALHYYHAETLQTSSCSVLITLKRAFNDLCMRCKWCVWPPATRCCCIETLWVLKRQRTPRLSADPTASHQLCYVTSPRFLPLLEEFAIYCRQSPFTYCYLIHTGILS